MHHDKLILPHLATIVNNYTIAYLNGVMPNKLLSHG